MSIDRMLTGQKEEKPKMDTTDEETKQRPGSEGNQHKLAKS